MLPSQYIPFASQLGMSDSLGGARRSAHEQGLSQALIRHLIPESDLKAVLERFQSALGSMLAQDSIEFRLQLAVHANLKPTGGRKSAKQLEVDQAREERSKLLALLELSPPLPDSCDPKHPLAAILALTMHCLGHALAETAFTPQDDDPAEAEDPGADMEDDHGAEDVALDAAEVSRLQGSGSEAVGKMPVTLAFVELRLGRALRSAALQRWIQRCFEELDSADREATYRRAIETFGISEASCSLVARVLLSAIPEAFEGNPEPLSWKTEELPGKARTVKRLEISDAVHDRLTGYLKEAPLTETLQPLTSPPSYRNGLSELQTSGTTSGRLLPLVRYRHSNKALETFHHRIMEPADIERCVEAIDEQQRVAWRLNLGVLKVAQTLEKLGPGEAQLPAELEGLAGVQIAQWCKFVYQKLFALDGGPNQRKIMPGNFLRNSLVTSVIKDAGSESGKAKTFYLPWKADYRGRIYPETPWFSPQGGDLQRALLEFAEGKVLDDKGWIALKRHGANLVKRDIMLRDLGIQNREVLTLDERVSWIDARHKQIIASAKTPFSESFWSIQSSKPWQFLAFCLAYAQAKEHPELPCHTPVQIDGTCNGLQHIAALTGDAKLARAVNVCPEPNTSVPGDLYSEIADLARRFAPTWIEKKCKAAGQEVSALSALSNVTITHEAVMAVVSSPRLADHRQDLLACVPAGIDAETRDHAVKALSKLLTSRVLRQRRRGVVLVDPQSVVEEARQELSIQLVQSLEQTLGPELLRARLDLLDRQAVKPIIMTIPYGAGAKSQARNLARGFEIKPDLTDKERSRLDALRQALDAANPGKGLQKIDRNNLAVALLTASMVKLIREVLRMHYPILGKFSGYLGEVAKTLAGVPLLWSSPLGWPIFQDGFKLEQNKTAGLTIKSGTTVTIAYTHLLEIVDPKSQRSKLMPNLIHGLDASHLLMTLLGARKAGLEQFGSIHDCLLVLPNDADTMGSVVREQFAKLYRRGKGSQVPDVFSDWAKWMELVADAARFPRPHALMDALRKRYSEKDAAAPYFEWAYRQATKGDLVTDPLSAAQQDDLKRIVASAGQWGPSRVVWLHFLLKCRNDSERDRQTERQGGQGMPEQNRSVPFPALPVAKGASFDIEGVKSSPYFFC